VAVLFVTSTCALAQEPQPNVATEGLTPCLAVLCDGSPVYPSESFPPSKQITAAFRLPRDATAKALKSKWIALDGGEKVLAENILDLQGQKRGWLRLELKEPAAPGKYRIDTMLDDKPWKSVNLEIAPPITEGILEKPSDLLIVADGASHAFDAAIRPTKDAPPMNPDGMVKDKDGVYRGSFVVSYDQPKDGTLRRTILVNGKPGPEMRVKLDDSGLVCTQTIENGKTTDVNPPRNVHPLPPLLTHGITWKCASDVKGANQDLVFFGPLTLQGPDGPATGYIIYGEGPVEGVAPGSTGVNVQTMERHYIPKTGVVRENRAVLVDGKLIVRQEFTLAPPGYRLVADPAMKGRLGRVQFDFPKDTKTSGAPVQVFKGDAPASGGQPLSESYGAKKFDLMPGSYQVAISGKRVPVVVKSGHATIPRAGVLRVHASSGTHWRVLNPVDKSELVSDYGEKDVALPTGKVLLEISGATEEITIADGQVVDF
jgi:hypothetical protein